MGSLVTARFFCDHCKKETSFLPIQFAVALTGVSRSTMYYWMDRRWIHWRELPSRRRIICKESLSHAVEPAITNSLPVRPQPISPAPIGASAKAAPKSAPSHPVAR